MSNIDALIAEITSTSYNENIMMESYSSADYYTYDLMKSNMDKSCYFSCLDNLIKIIEKNVINKNHSESRKYIRLFLDMFYFSKWGAFNESSEVLDRFINVCYIYAFFFCEEMPSLAEWKHQANFMTEGFSIQTFDKLNSVDFLDLGYGKWKDFLAQQLDQPYETIYNRFHAEIKLYYSRVRDDPSTAIEIIKELDKIIDLFSSGKFDSSFCIILTSALSLKYDLLLQQHLDKDIVDEYVNKIHFLIERRYIYNNYESHFKIIEMLTKCQYAYNLLHNDTYLYPTYTALLKDYYKLYDMRTLFFNNTISAEHFQLSLIEAYRVIYYRPEYDYNKEFAIFFSNSVLKEAYFTIVLSAWNEFKYRYYKLNLNNLTIEGKYDFIYKLD